MAKFIKMNDGLSEFLINIDGILSIDFDSEPASDYEIQEFARRHKMSIEDVEKTVDLGRTIYRVTLINNESFAVDYINGNCPDPDELLALLNKSNKETPYED